MTMFYESLSVAGCVIAIGSVVAYNRSVWRELDLARRETSRFPLFAARSHLVRMIATGKMREDNRAWRDMYETVNFLLDMHQRLHLLDFVSRYIRFALSVQRDSDHRQRVEEAKLIADEAEKVVPEFAAIREEVASAFVFMTKKRTSRFHLMAVYALAATLRIAATAAKAGVGPAFEVARIVHSSRVGVSTDQLQVWRGDCAA